MEILRFPQPQTLRQKKNFGKLHCRYALMKTVAGGYSHLLCITDTMTEIRYLVDTGADVSVLPRNNNSRLQESVFNLQVENEKPITTFTLTRVYANLCDEFMLFQTTNANPWYGSATAP
ncbi:unnamed protein product [Schistosoma spindalis]|nr:unnamed protein product [Schistosoma spindale]